MNVPLPELSRLERLSLMSITVTTLLTAGHHVIRLGLEVLPAAGVILVLPFVILYAAKRTQRRWLLWPYTAVVGLVFIWFGFVDGFLDHVLKAVGLSNVTVLPGGEAEVVDTVYSLGSQGLTNAIYEGSGVLTFLASVTAVVVTTRLLRAAYRQTQRSDAAPGARQVAAR